MAKTMAFTKTALLLAIRGNPDSKAPKTITGDNAFIEKLWQDDVRKSSYGHIPTIAARLGCSDQTVRNYASRVHKKTGELTRQAKDIAVAIAAEKELGRLTRADFHHDLIRDAEKGLQTNIQLLDERAIEFALSRLDKENYAARTEMTGAAGAALYDDDAQQALAEIYEALAKMGVDPSEKIVDALMAMKAKIAALSNRGKG